MMQMFTLAQTYKVHPLTVQLSVGMLLVELVILLPDCFALVFTMYVNLNSLSSDTLLDLVHSCNVTKTITPPCVLNCF